MDGTKWPPVPCFWGVFPSVPAAVWPVWEPAHWTSFPSSSGQQRCWLEAPGRLCTSVRSLCHWTQPTPSDHRLLHSWSSVLLQVHTGCEVLKLRIVLFGFPNNETLYLRVLLHRLRHVSTEARDRQTKRWRRPLAFLEDDEVKHYLAGDFLQPQNR